MNDHDDLILKSNEYAKNNQKTEDIVTVSKLAWRILDDIIKILKPGITEAEAVACAFDIFKQYDIKKYWHRPIIRFNQHTLCSFKDRPKEDYCLKEVDIAFVDIGIVKDCIEGDVGKTVIFGDNPLFFHLKNVSELLFEEAANYWKNFNPTGIELYEFIHTQAKLHDVLFNLSPAGHLIGAFPHTHAWTKGANTYPSSLLPKGWILEIQIKSLNSPYGAFYENLLY